MEIIGRKVLRPRCRRAGLAVFAMLALAVASPAVAADLPPEPPAKAPAKAPAAPEWRFQATGYAWTTALNGDLGLRNLPTVPVDLSIPQVLRNLDGALMGSFFGTNGEWMFLADLVVAKLSHSQGVGAPGGNLDVSLTETVATGAVGYLLPTGRPDLEVALTAGLRYVRLKGEMTLTLGGLPAVLSASQAQGWLDPTVGLFAHWAINDRWFVNLIVDIGGFGVGSDLSSTGYLGVGYMWTKSFSTGIGYRYLYENYEGPGAQTGVFRYDTVMHGPTLSFAWYF